MIVQKPETYNKFILKIDLAGEAGNAFCLLACAKRLAIVFDLDFAVIEQEMTAADYENLVLTFDRYFGETVLLECDELLFKKLRGAGCRPPRV